MNFCSHRTLSLSAWVPLASGKGPSFMFQPSIIWHYSPHPASQCILGRFFDALRSSGTWSFSCATSFHPCALLQSPAWEGACFIVPVPKLGRHLALFSCQKGSLGQQFSFRRNARVCRESLNPGAGHASVQWGAGFSHRAAQSPSSEGTQERNDSPTLCALE